jgi:Domain of unknown function (DUF4340)
MYDNMQRNTLILLMIALSLSTAVYYLQHYQEIKKELSESQKSSEKIFDFTREEIKTITIKNFNQTLEFERVESSQWQMKKPQNKPANNASVAFLLHLLTTAKKTESFLADQTKLQEYGLDQPQTIIEITLKGEKKGKLILGKTNFNGSLLYAMNDQRENNQIEVLLIPIDFQYAINRKDW